MEINIGSNSSCKISLLRSSRINHPFIPSLSRRGLRGGQDQIFKSHGILGKLVNKGVDDQEQKAVKGNRVGFVKSAFLSRPSEQFLQGRPLSINKYSDPEDSSSCNHADVG